MRMPRSLLDRPMRLVPALLLLASPAAAQDAAESRARWEAAAIESYEYSYQRACECHPDDLADTIVTVRGGEIVAVRYARADYVEDVSVAESRLSWFRTVDDLFALIEGAASSAAVVRASFDPELGYPTAIYVDRVADLVGDEVDLRFTGLRPL